MQYTSFLKLKDEESTTVSGFVSVDVSGKQGKTKKRKSSKDFLIHSTLDADLIGGMVKRREETAGKHDGQLIGRVGCMNERREWKRWKGS